MAPRSEGCSQVSPVERQITHPKPADFWGLLQVLHPTESKQLDLFFSFFLGGGRQKLMLPKSYNFPKTMVTLSYICFGANLPVLPWVGRNALRDPERIRRGIVSIPAMPPCNCISARHGSCLAWDKGWKQPVACLK